MVKATNMAVNMKDAELTAFLAPFVHTEGPRYRSADWLFSDFDYLIWRVNFESELEIDWRVEIVDTGLLTSPRHAELWEVLRSWLILQTHVDLTGGIQYSAQSKRHRVQRTIHCIDYILLNAQTLGIAIHGLAALTNNDLRAMVAAISSSSSIMHSVYQWRDRLTAYLRTNIAGLTSDDIEHAFIDAPGLNLDIPNENDRLTGLSTDEVVKARAWLWLQGGYKSGRGEYRYEPKTLWLAERIYMNTLWGKQTNLSVPVELCLSGGQGFVTEYPRARVRSKRDERMLSSSLNKYVETIASLSLLQGEGLSAPFLRQEEIMALTTSLDVKATGRFRTLPHEVVFTALRRAIEFALENGDALVDSYLALARVATARGQSVKSFAGGNDIRPFLTEGARALGVENWTIDTPFAGAHTGSERLDKSAYFAAIRANKGLYECLRVLYGAIQVAVGTLMARRQGELLDLVAGACLDTSRTRMVFANRKSGFMDMRQHEARPIPPVAVRLIGILDRLQASLIDMGILTSTTQLFNYPAKYGETRLITHEAETFNASIDWFCDWAELPLDQEGSRYYIRQHQLRRFFAMLFFWGGGFGGMDTLRWFLGHTNVEHLWNYITEFTPGATVRSVAAQWAAYGIKHATKEAELLGAELNEHFGVDDFSVLEEEALQLYLEDLIEEGRLTIEPQFLDGGNRYRIAVILRPKAGKA
jgi:hypothetical protein